MVRYPPIPSPPKKHPLRRQILRPGNVILPPGTRSRPPYGHPGGKTHHFLKNVILRFLTPMIWVKFSPVAGFRQPLISGTECRVCNFCAFYQAIKEHGFFLNKTLRLQKPAIKRVFSIGVGTLSHAEFLPESCMMPLRRRIDPTGGTFRAGGNAGAG